MIYSPRVLGSGPDPFGGCGSLDKQLLLTFLVLAAAGEPLGQFLSAQPKYENHQLQRQRSMQAIIFFILLNSGFGQLKGVSSPYT